ncbi:response regulator transcription factor [Serratia fonticola]|uniref:helix-turn-helix transcriptional regulator n=1 Tax=Serratia fonticola TaxID=47917 RepID=UPI001645C1A7|nr:LuxR C-terminal-related transcriptional regulator [Serratia fonticola]MBC3252362.1 response regulator transcription factor [Serratia fonticola]
MTHTITIAIFNTDRYFAQGLKALLHHYFTRRNIPVRFVSGCAGFKAILIFKESNVRHSVRFCRQRHVDGRQRVIIIQNSSYYHRPCLSEQGMIDRNISVNALLQNLEQVLATPPCTEPVEKCPRCAQKLTLREYQILSALEQGRQVAQIALQMKLSPKTISGYKRCAMAKLGFNRNADLYYWLQSGELDYEKGCSFNHTAFPC